MLRYAVQCELLRDWPRTAMREWKKKKKKTGIKGTRKMMLWNKLRISAHILLLLFTCIISRIFIFVNLAIKMLFFLLFEYRIW